MCELCNSTQHYFQFHFLLSFICDICGDSFKAKYALDEHIISKHDGNKPFHCVLCDRGFTRKGRFKRHVEFKHGGKTPFKCDICDYGCAESDYLKKHMKVHERKKVV